MNMVVGKEGHNTVLFTGDLSMVVFSRLTGIVLAQ